MLRLRGLSVDGKPPIGDPDDFEIRLAEGHENIFTFVHYAGSVKGGRLDGTWNPPGPGSTNSVLLWPDAFKYLVDEANKLGVT